MNKRLISAAQLTLECEVAKVDARKVDALARRLFACAIEAQQMGLTIFAGSGGCSIRRQMHDGLGPVIVAEIPGRCWDGGDGGAMHDERGVLRGEN